MVCLAIKTGLSARFEEVQVDLEGGFPPDFSLPPFNLAIESMEIEMNLFV